MTPSKIRLLLPFLLLLALGCGKSGGGGKIEDLCQAYCENITECLDGFDEGESLCRTQCEDDFDDADELDGSACVDAQFETFECVIDATCTDVFEFLLLKQSDLPTAFCTAEINTALAECPLSIDLQGS